MLVKLVQVVGVGNLSQLHEPYGKYNLKRFSVISSSENP